MLFLSSGCLKTTDHSSSGQGVVLVMLVIVIIVVMVVVGVMVVMVFMVFKVVWWS